MTELKIIDETDHTLKAILDGIGEGISVIDEDLKIVWVNSIIEKWAGSLEDIRGKNCYKVYQKTDAPCEHCPTVKTFETGKIGKVRQHAYDTQGNIRYFEFISAPMVDGDKKIQAVVELAVDLTERVELEHKLKETKDNLQAVFDGIGDGISVINKDCQILRVNHGILQMFNKRDFSGLIGKKCFTEYFKNADICDNCPAQRTFKTGNPSHATKIYQRMDKGRTVLEISTFPIKDSQGQINQVGEYIRNVTDTIKLEDQLLYQERLAATGELAAGIAHEIRNPLSNITASAQLCMSEYKLPEPVKKYLQIVLRNAQNANLIIKDLLDLAKPNEISFKFNSIRKVILSACSLIRPKCSKQGVRLTQRISRRLPSILLDEKRLEEVFLNFILNALDAMPEGGRLAITAYPNSENNEVVINFLDTGCGISSENSNRLFQPFFTTKNDGVGLGLYLARQVISHHKGKIGIESKVGQGTKVIVKLPISRTKEEKQEL